MSHTLMELQFHLKKDFQLLKFGWTHAIFKIRTLFEKFQAYPRKVVCSRNTHPNFNDYTPLKIYTFSHLKCPFYRAKNKKKCKINSRNFTYDGLTFSSSVFILEEVKDEI
jgi:hypothetical protein